MGAPDGPPSGRPPAHPAEGKAGGVACHVCPATGFSLLGGGGWGGGAPTAPRRSGRPRGGERSCPRRASEGWQGQAAPRGGQRGPIFPPRAPLPQALASGGLQSLGVAHLGPAWPWPAAAEGS